MFISIKQLNTVGMSYKTTFCQSFCHILLSALNRVFFYCCLSLGIFRSLPALVPKQKDKWKPLQVDNNIFIEIITPNYILTEDIVLPFILDVGDYIVTERGERWK